MKTSPKDRALDICLEHVHTGTGLDEVLQSYPEWKDEFRPILEAAQAASYLGSRVKASQANSTYKMAQAKSRAQFLQAAQRKAEPIRSGRTTFNLRFGLALTIAILVFGFGAVRTVTAAQQSLPGQPLYTLKIATERTRLLLAQSTSQRLDLENEFDEEREHEVQTLISQNHTALHLPEGYEVDFFGPLRKSTPANWKVGTIQVLISANTQVIGQVKDGFHVEVEGKLQTDGSVVADRIQAREYELDGIVQKVSADRWIIDGVQVNVTSQTVILGLEENISPINHKVNIKALRTADNALQARLIEFISRVFNSVKAENTTRNENRLIQKENKFTAPPVFAPISTEIPRVASPEPVDPTKDVELNQPETNPKENTSGSGEITGGATGETPHDNSDGTVEQNKEKAIQDTQNVEDTSPENPALNGDGNQSSQDVLNHEDGNQPSKETSDHEKHSGDHSSHETEHSDNPEN